MGAIRVEVSRQQRGHLLPRRSKVRRWDSVVQRARVESHAGRQAGDARRVERLVCEPRHSARAGDLVKAGALGAGVPSGLEARRMVDGRAGCRYRVDRHRWNRDQPKCLLGFLHCVPQIIF